MLRKLIIFLCLKGSWPWAVKQMKRGYCVKHADHKNLRYRISDAGGEQILSSFNGKQWGPALLFLTDFQAIDWQVMR